MLGPRVCQRTGNWADLGGRHAPGGSGRLAEDRYLPERAPVPIGA